MGTICAIVLALNVLRAGAGGVLRADEQGGADDSERGAARVERNKRERAGCAGLHGIWIELEGQGGIVEHLRADAIRVKFNRNGGQLVGAGGVEIERWGVFEDGLSPLCQPNGNANEDKRE